MRASFGTIRRRSSRNRPNVLLVLAYWLVSVWLLLLFARLTTPPSALDLGMLAQMSEMRSAGLDGFFRVVTWLGSLYVLAPFTTLVLRWLILRGRTLDAWRVGLGFGGTVAAVYIVKAFLAKPRPDLFPMLVTPPLDLSFPSAHAAQVTTMVTAALLMRPLPGGRYRFPLMAIGIVLVCAVGVSRLYLQVHYPSDILAGAAYGVYWVLALESLLRAAAYGNGAE